MVSGHGTALCGSGGLPTGLGLRRNSSIRSNLHSLPFVALTVHRTLSTAIHVVENDKPPLRQLTASLRSPILRNALLGNPCGEADRRGGVSVRRMARDGSPLYSSRGISEVESLAFPPRSSFYDDGLPVQSSRAGSTVSYHLGSAVPLQKMRAAAANADIDRKICSDVVVRSAEAGVHLHLWARHIEGSGAAHHGNRAEQLGAARRHLERAVLVR
jgi:hypothetical protein